MRALLALVLAGCFSPTYPEGIRCGPPPDECPPGQTCGADGRCHAGAADAPVAQPDADPALPDAAPAEPDASCPPASACDGPDSDLCAEGTTVCGVCDDTTGDTVETCNTLDDDCDGSTDEDFDLTSDESNCGACGTACTNAYGTTQCLASDCLPMCSAGAMNCDANPDNGCELRDSNPACVTEAIALGSVSGDIPGSMLMTMGDAEAFYRVTVVEMEAGALEALTARVELNNPGGADFDLYVYCLDCGGVLAGSDTGGFGGNRVVELMRQDMAGGVMTFDILIEIRYGNAVSCGDWELRVIGDSGGAGADAECL